MEDKNNLDDTYEVNQETFEHLKKVEEVTNQKLADLFLVQIVEVNGKYLICKTNKVLEEDGKYLVEVQMMYSFDSKEEAEFAMSGLKKFITDIGIDVQQHVNRLDRALNGGKYE